MSERQKLADLIATAFPAILAQYSPYKIADRILAEFPSQAAVIEKCACEVEITDWIVPLAPPDAQKYINAVVPVVLKQAARQVRRLAPPHSPAVSADQ